MTTINILAVLEDATSIAGQAGTWTAAAEMAVRWSEDRLYCERSPIMKVFFSNGEGLEETTVSKLKADLAAGVPQAADAEQELDD